MARNTSSVLSHIHAHRFIWKHTDAYTHTPIRPGCVVERGKRGDIRHFLPTNTVLSESKWKCATYKQNTQRRKAKGGETTESAPPPFLRITHAYPPHLPSPPSLNEPFLSHLHRSLLFFSLLPEPGPRGSPPPAFPLQGRRSFRGAAAAARGRA